MNFKTWTTRACMCLLVALAIGTLGTNSYATLAPSEVAQEDPPGIQFITADELKAKLAKNQPVTVIDVRSNNGSLATDNKIRGAIYVKLRRLKYRLGFPPLKNVSLNSEVVTYCACPNDESSVKAAQILMESGFRNIRVLKGGWVVWKKAKGQVEPFARGM